MVAAVVLVGGSGAGTTKTRGAVRVDVSTRSAVIHYLRSIHVNPTGVVIQRSARNYAGPNCPGKRWTCANTMHTVVQIAQRGGENRVVCRATKCVVLQFSGISHGFYSPGRQFASTAAPTGGGNSSVCLKNGSGSPSGSGQSCTITQSGPGPNTAVVWENSQKVAGLANSLTFTAVITQTATGASQGNKACVTQNINLDGSTTGLKGKPVTSTLDAHQSVTIKQDSGTGPNSASNAAVLSGTTAICDPNNNNILGQNQTLSSTVNATASITQNQNTANSGPNLSLDIQQNQKAGFFGSATGQNDARFVQTNTLTAIANTTTGPVSQTQSTNNGGLLAAVNQDSRGVSTAVATQVETQCEDAHKTSTAINVCHTDTADPPPSPFSLSQIQIGPLRKAPGDSFQTGNANDTFTVSQKSTQDSDLQSGKTNTIAGGVTTDGTGTITQTTDIQNVPKKNVHAGDDTTVNGNMNCSSGSACTKNLSAPTITAHTTPTTYGEDASFSFSNVDDTVAFVCSTDDVTYTACGNAPPSGVGTKVYSNLPSGAHTFFVKSKDPDNGSLSAAASYGPWVIIPPDPVIDTGPSGDTYSADATFTFHDADSTTHLLCNLDNAATYTNCDSGSATYTGLADGAHTFKVKATDASGTYESGDRTRNWTVISIVVFNGAPGTGAPPSTLGGYPMTGFGLDTQDVGVGVSGVDDAAGSIDFSTSLKHDRIGNGWATWSHGYTGDVYDTCFTQPGPTCDASDPSQVTITLPPGTKAFYFYAEPNNLTTFHVTATSDSTTSGSVDVVGSSGAKYFGFYGTANATIDTITVVADDPLGFAVGEFGISPATGP
jgi:hypothetical protein